MGSEAGQGMHSLVDIDLEAPLLTLDVLTVRSNCVGERPLACTVSAATIDYLKRLIDLDWLATRKQVPKIIRQNAISHLCILP